MSDKRSIKHWSEDDQPREKLLQKGKSSLSNAELLAILIGSGNKEESAVDLAKRILQEYDNSLVKLGKASLDELLKFKGIGEAKAVTINAALDLGRRRQFEPQAEAPQIRSSADAAPLFQRHMSDLQSEEFWVLFLNRANRVIAEKMISAGGITATVVDMRIIFKLALEQNATSLILGHNHPSGNLKPSQADIDLTKKAVESGKLLDIKILDHLIISTAGYLSLADEGLI